MMHSQEQERLKFCNRCINKKEDPRFSVLFGFTDQNSNFFSISRVVERFRTAVTYYSKFSQNLKIKKTLNVC